MKRLMIYYAQFPDLATSKNERGETEYLGSIQGKSCSVPVVDCPKHGPRLPLQACLDCPHGVAIQTNYIECVADSNILGKAVQPQPIKKVEAESHPTVNGRPQPKGVFKPKK